MAFDIMHAGRYIMAAASGTTNVADESVSDVIDSACFFLFGKQSDQMDQENRTPVF